jgi:hypothetical protein
MKHKKTPNCARCKWLAVVNYFLCKAIGFEHVSSVYNKRLCKKLYEPERDNIEMSCKEEE